MKKQNDIEYALKRLVRAVNGWIEAKNDNHRDPTLMKSLRLEPSSDAESSKRGFLMSVNIWFKQGSNFGPYLLSF